MAGDALTDIDFTALSSAHESNDGIATLAVKRVADVSEFGVVVTDAEGRVQGFQEKPDPAEALSDLTNCMIYVFSPEVFDYFPDGEVIDFALDVFPALLEQDVPFHVHRFDEYWNDIGSIAEYLQGTSTRCWARSSVDPGGELGPAARARRTTWTQDGGWELSGRGAGGRGRQRRRGRPHRRPGRDRARRTVGAGREVKRVGAAARRRGPGGRLRRGAAIAGRRGRLAAG